MSVIVGDAFSDPQTSGVGGPCEIPGTKLNRPQALDIPYVKELMSDSIERLFVHPGISERAGLDDLRGREMLHSVIRVTIVREVNQKTIRIEFWRPPHRGFGAHNFFNITHQGGSLAGLASH